jgi:predicted unusual protein kinase regulating ubiquinone biosynthesis (AarF/ABC1/UbiB family)
MTEDHVEGGRFKRMARLAGVAARTTRDILAAKAREKLTGANESDLAASLQPTAERLVEVLGELKGAATKLGQFAALVDQDTLPAEARKALTRLMNQTPQRMTFAQVDGVVERELGAKTSSLFAHFEPEPLASASMGQVHAATTHAGQDVVVKIQFPGIDKAIESDLRNVSMIAKTLSIAGNLLDGRAYTDELAATLRRELDYRQEVQQADAFRAAVEPWPELVIPRALLELSSERVLTLERLRGPTLLEFTQDPDAPADRRLAVAQHLMTATWGPFLRARLVHADPHPGNYIVLPDGRLGVLDFGATKLLSVPFTTAYWSILDACFEGRRADLLALLESAGFHIQGDRVKVGSWLDELGDIVERPLRADDYDWGACRMTPDIIALKQKHLLAMLRFRAPEESLMFYRAAAGVAGDLRMLKARGDFRASMLKLRDTARATLTPEMAKALDAG